MKPIFNTLIGLLLLLSSAVVNAQLLDIKFTPAMPGGTVGSVITVDVVANKFEGIAGMTFPILYDKNKLQFKTIKSLTPDLPGFIYNQATGTPSLCPGGGLPPCSSSIDNPVAGKIALLWFDPAGTGNYLDPNTVLFRIEFTVLQAGTSNMFVSPTETPALNVIGMMNVKATFIYPVGVTPPPAIVGFALIIPQDSVRPGETMCVPVTVNDFINVVGMQFVVNYQSSVFSFSHLQGYNLAGLNCSNFNPTTGRVTVNWEDATGAGVTVPNSTAIFEVCLIANGPSATNGTTTTIVCNGNGLAPASPIAIENAMGVNLWSEPNSGVPGTILVSSTAQFEDEIVRYKADTVNVAQVGDSASVAIKVRKFKNINQFQFVVSYDVAVLGTGLPRLITTLPNGTSANCTVKVDQISGQPGKLRVSWRACSATNGQTFADDATLMTLRFPTSSAAPGAMTNVTIGSLETVVPPIPLQTQERPNAYMAPPNQLVPSCPYKPRTDNGWVKMGTLTAVPTITLVNKTDVNCFGVNIGAIDISVAGGLTTAYTYKWSNTPMSTTQDLTGVGAGTYTVTVTSGTTSTTFSATIAGPSSAISVPSNTVTLTNVKCFGGTDGAISINPTGGTAPYTYLWNNATTAQNRTALGGGSYTVTITDSKGCTFAPAAYPVTAPSVAMSVTSSNIKNIRCLNDLNGGVTLTPAGTQGSVTYAWKNTSGSAVAASPASAPTNLAAGTYSVTLTDGNNCTTSTANIVITAPLSAFTIDPAIVTAPACAGQNNGTITINSFGGWAGAATIQWSNPVPGNGGFNPMGVAPGTYNATVTDAGSCAKAISASVGPGVDNNITNTTATNVTCFSQANGSITITLSAPFTSVNWTMNGAAAGSGTTISNLGPGTYIPTVSFGVGCTKVFPAVTISEPAALVVSLVSMTQQGQTNDGALDIDAIGGNTGVITYSWTGPNGFTANTQDITSLAAGDYTVTVKDVKNCQTVQTYTVTKACLICDAIVSDTVNACLSDGCFTVKAPASATGPFILSWTSSVNPVSQSKTSNEYLIEVCNLPSGIYAPTITDATNTPFELPTFQIAQRPQVAVTSLVTNSNLDNKNGSISLTSGPGLALSYDWSMSPTAVPQPPNSLSSPVIFQLDSGTYCVKIKNLLPEGCEETRCFDVVRLYPALAPCGTVTPLQPNCLTSNNGAIEVFPQGGDNVFTYAWSSGQTTKKISNLAGGTYTVTITSGDGQTGTCGPYILAPQSTLAISNVNEISDFNGFQVSGVGVCNGSAGVVVTGTTTAVSYLWSNGATGENNTTLCGGTYTVVATDQTGCTSTWSGTLTTPTVVSTAHTLLTDFNDYSVSCNGVCDGVARVTVTGGVPPYIVKWPSGQIDVVNTNGGVSIDNDLCAGDTEVEVTDANGIKVAYTLELTEPDPIVITFTDAKPFSLANCNAEIIPEVTGAVGTITYEWFSQYHQGNTQRADGLCADEEVTFIITDDNGCTETAKHNAPLPEGICFNVNPILTPNGDGNNDLFDIKCINTVSNTLEIYDRWNQAVVKPIVNYQNNWDGKRNGVLVPEGVYFFVATYLNDQGIEMTIKGHFNILY